MALLMWPRNMDNGQLSGNIQKFVLNFQKRCMPIENRRQSEIGPVVIRVIKCPRADKIPILRSQGLKMIIFIYINEIIEKYYLVLTNILFNLLYLIHILFLYLMLIFNHDK